MKNTLKSRYKAVIYDCDGVILDTLESNYIFYNRVMAHLGRPPLDRNDHAAREVLHTYSFNNVMEYFFAEDSQKEQAREFARTIHYRDLAPFMRMEDGFKETLDHLKGIVSLAVCTNRAISMDMIIDDFGLTGYFDSVVAAGKMSRPKPHPEPLWKVLEEVGVAPAEALYIGDGEVDMQAANSAGIAFIAYKSALPALACIKHHQEVLQHIFV